MPRTLLVMLAIFAVVAPIDAGWAASDNSEVSHSGTVLDVQGNASRLVLEEMVTWTGPGTGLVRREVELTPDTSIYLVRRSDRWDGSSRPGFDETVIRASDLRPGDFVTVVTRQGRVAVSMNVMRPNGNP